MVSRLFRVERNGESRLDGFIRNLLQGTCDLFSRIAPSYCSMERDARLCASTDSPFWSTAAKTVWLDGLVPRAFISSVASDARLWASTECPYCRAAGLWKVRLWQGMWGSALLAMPLLPLNCRALVRVWISILFGNASIFLKVMYTTTRRLHISADRDATNSKLDKSLHSVHE